jgi:very-short-patch-repair endonuclease
MKELGPIKNKTQRHNIERNIQRDSEVNMSLLKNGWEVLRFWGK